MPLASGLWLWLCPRRPAQLLLATAAALPVASDRHESHELGATKAAARVLQPYLDALASLTASVHFECQITVQPSPACHLTCWDPLNREWR